MKRCCLLLLAALIATAPAHAGDTALSRFDFEDKKLTQWKLPNKLREISGLVFHDGRLYGHDDQQGIVYQIDYNKGRLVKAFALGRRTVQDDFEGIAIAGDNFWLVTSDGRLYFAREGDNGQRVPYQSIATGLKNRCEIEGLAHDAKRDRLLLVCKQPRSSELDGDIAIFSWSLSAHRIVEKDTIIVKRSALHKGIPGKQFNPSGIEVDAATGNLLLVAARQRAIAEVRMDGKVIDSFVLPLAKRHRQAEGIALAGATLILADEGRTKKARLAVYGPKS
ncbi:MAG: SdiA-regulated domain-containing protein [Gammaproteobacteria bacterium]|nr:SdiA-regulated domain-containing protein [Gammaproteobacteria bacterium]NNF61155.1 hypothetical protein [Gammaproteobacteria bacterium]NNM19755.1 hypothetical protein [Gammaproteobacteria bacterium]